MYKRQGKVRRGHWTLEDTNAVNERVVDGILLKRFEVSLPRMPGVGYHLLNITCSEGDDTQTSLIVTPQSCYQPAELESGRKLWGIALQLYTLRSPHNWGIGDFEDLLRAVDTLAPLGVNIIGLNPLHALFPHLPEQASPYSPTSRDFLNPLYLSVEAIDEFERCGEVQQLLAEKNFQARLETLRETILVDYTGVCSAKLLALKMLYQCFRQQDLASNSPRAKSFRQFQVEGGSDLQNFGLFEALHCLLYTSPSPRDRS